MRWDRLAKANTLVRLQDEFADLTLEIAGKTLFSDAFEDSADDIRRWTRTINTYSSIPPNRVLNNMRFPSYLNLRLRRTLREYREFLRQVIATRTENPSQDDLLSILLTMRDDETGEPMSLTEVADEVLGMIIGGHETSSVALAWTIFELQRNPEIERRVVAEIDQVMTGATLDLAKLSGLSLTRQVIEESLRLYPPVWFENRNVKEDIEVGGVLLPKGSTIALSRYSLHRNGDFWESPDAFIPGRFDPDDEENYVDSKSMGIYIPFSRGPRVCIGRHFAMSQMLVILATLLSRFRIHATEPHGDAISARLTIELRNHLPVRLEMRT